MRLQIRFQTRVSACHRRVHVLSSRCSGGVVPSKHEKSPAETGGAFDALHARSRLFDRYDEQDAFVAGKFGRDMIELDDAALLVALARPDCADFAGGAEAVIALGVLSDDAGEGHAVGRFGFGFSRHNDLRWFRM